jgi:hypothetical protein
VRAKGPTTLLVAEPVPLSVAPEINDNRLVEVVLMIPEVIVSVPLIDNGTLRVIPVVFVLLMVKAAILAVGVKLVRVVSVHPVPVPPVVAAGAVGTTE